MTTDYWTNMLYRDFQLAAHRLAVLLRDYPWYHRTSVREYPQTGLVVIVVWGEGETCPPEVPATWEKWPVVFERVTEKRPCPFGSVKP